MLQIEDVEHVTGEWIDASLITLLACEEVRSVQPSNPVFDKSEPITLPLVINPPSKDYGQFAINVQVILPVSNDERDDDLSIVIIGDFTYEPSEDDEDSTEIMPAMLYTVLYDNDETPLMVKDLRRKGFRKEEAYMKVLPDFYATGHTDADIKRWGMVV